MAHGDEPDDTDDVDPVPDDPAEDEVDDDPDPEPRARPHDRHARRSGFEGLLRDSFRKAVKTGLEAGIGTLKSADSVVSKVVDEVKMPREISQQVFAQIDETKNVMIRAVAHEVREFLETTDLAKELQRALTSLSFEIRTEIRFIPNESGELEPQVKSRTVPRAARRERARPRARAGRVTAEDADDEPSDETADEDSET